MKREPVIKTVTRHAAVVIMGCAAFALTGAAGADIAIGDVVKVQNSSGKANTGSYDRRTKEMRYTATLINLTDDIIIAPVYVNVTNISRNGIWDVQHDDQFSDGRGVYRVDADMEPGEQIKKQFTFHNPEKYKFEFDVEIWVTSALNPDVEPAE